MYTRIYGNLKRDKGMNDSFQYLCTAIFVRTSDVILIVLLQTNYQHQPANMREIIASFSSTLALKPKN